MTGHFRGSGPIPVMAVGSVLTTIATGLIIARLYLRLRIQRIRILISDIMIILAWFSACAYLVLNAVLFNLGALNASVGTLLIGYIASPDRVQNVFKILYMCNIPLYLAFYFCKGALLSMYLDIFPDFMKKRRIFLWAVITYVISALIVSILVVSLTCLPIATNWDLSPTTTCPPMKNKIVFKTIWALHFAGDCFVFIPPWLIIGKLTVRRTMKIGIYATSLLGLVTLIFSILRYCIIMESEVGSSIPISTAMLWSILECDLGLIITCIPSLRPYFTRPSEDLPRAHHKNNKMSKATETVRTVGPAPPQKKCSSTMSSGETPGSEKESIGGTKRSSSSDAHFVSSSV